MQGVYEVRNRPFTEWYDSVYDRSKALVHPESSHTT